MRVLGLCCAVRQPVDNLCVFPSVRSCCVGLISMLLCILKGSYELNTSGFLAEFLWLSEEGVIRLRSYFSGDYFIEQLPYLNLFAFYSILSPKTISKPLLGGCCIMYLHCCNCWCMAVIVTIVDISVDDIHYRHAHGEEAIKRHVHR